MNNLQDMFKKQRTMCKRGWTGGQYLGAIDQY